MKIYLAGNDARQHAEVLHLVDYPHRLCSYFYMGRGIARSNDVLSFTTDGSDWIIDSGLFSLMFGAGKGKLTTFEDYFSYAKKYVETLKEWGWKHAIVECDVQRVLGVAETNRIRDEVMRPSGFEVIYVWHLPEGEDGLRKLAATEKRIALSIPELRNVLGTGAVGGSSVKTLVTRLLQIIREAGTPRVHLLGNTENDLMFLPADSCDSTSWLSGGRWGMGAIFDGSPRLVMASIYSPRWDEWATWCLRTYPQVFHALDTNKANGGQRRYYHIAAMNAISYKLLAEAMNAH